MPIWNTSALRAIALGTALVLSASGLSAFTSSPQFDNFDLKRNVLIATVDLTGGLAIDFDNLQAQPGNVAGADLVLQVQSSKEALLVPQNGAALSARIAEQGIGGCRNQRFSTQGVRLAQIHPGSYVCFRTSEGRIGEFKVETATERAPFSMMLSFRFDRF